MTTHGLEYPAGDISIVFDFHIFNTQKQMIQTAKKRYSIEDPKNSIGLCGHPWTVYVDKVSRIVVDIFLCSDEYDEEVMYHEMYHGIRSIHQHIDAVRGHSLETEELCADIVGAFTVCARKIVLPTYKKGPKED